MAEQKAGGYSTKYRFTGKEVDEETGLYYFGARYYDPRISLWYGVDPLANEMLDWNPYRYGLNNPIRMIDPTGMKEEDGILPEVEVTDTRIPKKGEAKNTPQINCTTCNTPSLPDAPKVNSSKGTALNLAAGWAIAFGEPTPIGEFVMGVASTIAIIYYGPAIIDNTYTALEDIMDQSFVYSMKNNENIWPDEYGPKPTSKDLDWNKGDDQLAKEYAKKIGDSKIGPGSSVNKAKKVIQQLRPKK